MKKLMIFLLTAGMLSTFNAEAQVLIPPSAPELAMPTAGSGAIHIPVHTHPHILSKMYPLI